MQNEKRFIFRGNAVALAGHIRRPRDLVIPSQASSCLPATGGYAEGRSGPQNFHDIISFESAVTKASGDFINPARAAKFTLGNHGQNTLPARTSVTVEVRGLRVVNQGPNSKRTLTCGLVSAELHSEARRRGGQPLITAKVALEGLELDGHGLIVEFNDKLFSRYSTKAKLCEAYESDNAFHRKHGAWFFHPPGTAPRRGRRRMPETCGMIQASIVSSIHWAGDPHPEASIEGHSIVFPNFGSIYLGELMIGECERHLSMIRLQFGSPDGGDATVGSTDTDGQSWPP